MFIGIEKFKDDLWNKLKYPRKDGNDFVTFFENNKTINLDYKMVLTEPDTTTRDYILHYIPPLKLFR